MLPSRCNTHATIACPATRLIDSLRRARIKRIEHTARLESTQLAHTPLVNNILHTPPYRTYSNVSNSFRTIVKCVACEPFFVKSCVSLQHSQLIRLCILRYAYRVYSITLVSSSTKERHGRPRSLLIRYHKRFNCACVRIRRVVRNCNMSL